MKHQSPSWILSLISIVVLTACGRSEKSPDSATLAIQLNHLKCIVNVNSSVGQGTVRMDGTKTYAQATPDLIDTRKEHDEFEAVLKKLKDRCKIKSTELKFNPSACEEVSGHQIDKLKKDPQNASSSVFVSFDYKDNGKKYTGNYSCFMTSAPIVP